MKANFWLQRWKENNIRFHQSEANPFLIKYFNRLSLHPGARVFVPLCGKTLDISWLLANGYRVTGVELSELAIQQLFAELGVEPQISKAGELSHYNANGIDIFVGDFFHLTIEVLGPIDAIYDRAALVALPEEMRDRYTTHLTLVTEQAPQLLINYEYDQQSIEGPPFSISDKETYQHYLDHYEVTLVSASDVPGGLKGKCPAIEKVWLLKN